ncbi:sugar phosphate nucleotidyltransferase [Paenibacillus larvae]
MKVIIMAGGKGTRFWPKSKASKPKQFLALLGKETLIQQTYRRYREFLPEEDLYVVTATCYLPLLLEQLPELHADQIILEPEQRDTAPCIALTALHFLRENCDDVLVTTPSDQYIGDVPKLKEALDKAAEVARQGNLIVTLGVRPTRPETGYGYMEYEEELSYGRAYPVKRFIEKPSFDKAVELLKHSCMLWNSGIFIWKPSTICFYMEQLQPQMWKTLIQSGSSLNEVYPLMPKLSVDYAIMEQADSMFTIPVDFVWDDIGTWSSLPRFHDLDEERNVIQGEVSLLSSTGNIILSDKKTLILGVHDLIVVSTNEGLLVCHKPFEQYIKNVLAENGERE